MHKLENPLQKLLGWFPPGNAPCTTITIGTFGLAALPVESKLHIDLELLPFLTGKQMQRVSLLHNRTLCCVHMDCHSKMFSSPQAFRHT
jgi:hypothetical protein